MDDDGSGWDEVLLALWSDDTVAAVVRRIERAAVGRRGWLVRVSADPDRVRAELTETVHALVLAAIRDETGADLESLGSQGVWDCYEQVWSHLAGRWRDGGDLGTVPLTREPVVVELLRSLPVEAAVHAGADVRGTHVDPLWLRGRLRVDTGGLRAYLTLDGGRVPVAVRETVLQILAAVVELGDGDPGRRHPT